MPGPFPVIDSSAPERRSGPHALQPNALSLDLGMIEWLADGLTTGERKRMRDETIKRVRTAHYQHASMLGVAAEMVSDLKNLVGRDTKSDDLRRILLLNKLRPLCTRQIWNILSGFRGH